jgi:hypothetical protein
MSKPTRTHAVVLCNIHGKQSDLWEGQMVKVNQIPNTKKEKRAGCPICKKDIK